MFCRSGCNEAFPRWVTLNSEVKIRIMMRICGSALSCTGLVLTQVDPNLPALVAGWGDRKSVV